MQTYNVSVDHLVNSRDIGFSDSEGMIEDKRVDGQISFEERNELFATMSSAETKQKVLDWKLEECSDKFIDSIRRLGILNPVALIYNEVVNGHHRIAVAQHLGIEIPVEDYNNWEEFDIKHRWESAGLVDSSGEREC